MPTRRIVALVLAAVVLAAAFFARKDTSSGGNEAAFSEAVVNEAAVNEAIVLAMIEAVNARDLDALDTLVAASVQRHSAATPDVVVRSLDDFKAFLQADFATFPDSRMTVNNVVAAGDMVAVHAGYAGTQEGPMGPFPPSGKRMDLPFMGMLRIEDGKIAEMWVEWDNLNALGQLGHFPPPGAAPPTQ